MVPSSKLTDGVDAAAADNDGASPAEGGNMMLTVRFGT
jgi:hypothetical protein